MFFLFLFRESSGSVTYDVSLCNSCGTFVLFLPKGLSQNLENGVGNLYSKLYFYYLEIGAKLFNGISKSEPTWLRFQDALCPHFKTHSDPKGMSQNLEKRVVKLYVHEYIYFLEK